MTTSQTKLLQGLPPIAEKDARVLILGSFPGNDSLRAQEYYAHPRNQFWAIIEALFGISRGDDYAQRCLRLAACGVAVWDVIGRCRRYGSSNSGIRDGEANDFAAFYRRHPRIATVFFNGADTEKQYRRLVAPHSPVAIQSVLVGRRLPSTSPANTHLSLTDKIDAWRVLREAVDEETQMYLHEAISRILKAEGERGLTAKEIASLNAAQDLYRKGNNEFPTPRQVGLRVNDHGRRNTGWFEPENVTNNNTKIFLGPKNPFI